MTVGVALAEATHLVGSGPGRWRLTRRRTRYGDRRSLHREARPGIVAERGPQRSDRSLQRSLRHCLPWLASPSLAGATGEVVDSSTLYFLSASALQEQEKEELEEEYYVAQFQADLHAAVLSSPWAMERLADAAGLNTSARGSQERKRKDEDKRRRKKKKRRRKLPKSSSSRLRRDTWKSGFCFCGPFSCGSRSVSGCRPRSTRACCLVRQWIQVALGRFSHTSNAKLALSNLNLFSTSLLFLAVTFLVFLRQFLEAFGIILYIFFVLFPRTRQVCFKLLAARSFTTRLSLISALKVVRTAVRCTVRSLCRQLSLSAQQFAPRHHGRWSQWRVDG